MGLLFIFQFTAIVLLGLFLYYFALRELKWFSTSRIVLLFLVPLALVLPQLNQFFAVELPVNNLVIGLEEIVVTTQNAAGQTEAAGQANSYNWVWIAVLLIYSLGVFWQLFKLGNSYSRIAAIRKKSQLLSSENGLTIYQWSGHVPFTFMDKIFLPANLEKSSEDAEMILRHERYHVNHKHWVDKLWVQLLCTILWFFPPVYWIRAALEEVHEMQADRSVVQSFPRKSYMQLLLKQAIGRDFFSVNLVSPFITLTLKKRIKMIANKKSNPMYRLLLAGLSLFLVISIGLISTAGEIHAQANEDIPIEHTVYLSQNDSTPPVPPPPPPPKPDGTLHEPKTVFQVVQEMPRFPGCEDVSKSVPERKACADQKMLEFIYQNIRYPATAREDSIQGQVVVTFIVSDEGEIVNPLLARDIGGGCGQEAIRVIKLMNEMEDPWIPGRHEGENVNVQFNLPVRFSLQ